MRKAKREAAMAVAGLRKQVGQAMRKKKYDQAIRLQAQVVTQLERRLGPKHSDVARARKTKANIVFMAANFAVSGLRARYLKLLKKQKFKEAIKVSLRINAIYLKKLGPWHPMVATHMTYLASLYQAVGSKVMAVEYYRRALIILKKNLGPRHIQVETIRAARSRLLRSMGKEVSGLPAASGGGAMDRTSTVPGGKLAYISLLSTASILAGERQFDRAHMVYKQIIALVKSGKGLGPDQKPWTPRTRKLALSTVTQSLAYLCFRMGRYREAAGHYQKQLRSLGTRPGTPVSQVAVTMMMLALSRNRLGEHDKARKMFRRMMKVLAREKRPLKSLQATGYLGLAMVSYYSGKYKKALRLFKQGAKIYKKQKLSRGQGEAELATGLAVVQTAAGLPGRALATMKGVFALRWSQEKRVSAGMVFEEGEPSFASSLRGEMDLMLSLVLGPASGKPGSVLAAFNSQLRFKGVVMEALLAQRRTILRDQKLRRIWLEFQKAKRIHATHSRRKSRAPAGEVAWLKSLQQLSRRKEKLKLQLLHALPTRGQQPATRQADAVRLSKQMPRGRVLIEFTRPRILRFRARNAKKMEGPARYAAFLLRPGKRPVLHDLGDAEVIDKKVRSFRHALERGRREVLSMGEDGATAALRPFGKDLYRKLIAPLNKHIRPGEHLVISPEGELNMLPFEVLVGPSGKFLVEEHPISYVSSGRRVLGWRKQPWRPGKKVPALVLGDPDYGRPKGGGKGPFKRLSHTGAEIRVVAARLGGATILAGGKATEARLLKVSGVKVLHIATHGIFRQDAPRISRWKGGFFGQMSERMVKTSNPMLRSGLALSGANREYVSSRPMAPGDDGILTAMEAAQMNLEGTELVVLSACETGRGDVKRGEGVHGLRWGFEQAGARSQILSLWKVSDSATRRLMGDFYRRLMGGKGKLHALRAAVLEQIRRRRKQNGAAHPFFWGAFVLAGDPG